MKCYRCKGAEIKLVKDIQDTNILYIAAHLFEEHRREAPKTVSIWRHYWGDWTKEQVAEIMREFGEWEPVQGARP